MNAYYSVMLASTYLLMCSCQMARAQGQPGFGNEGFGAGGGWGAPSMDGYGAGQGQQWGGRPASEQEQHNSQAWGSAGMNGGMGAQGMPQMGGPGAIPSLQGPPQNMFQQVQSMYQQRLAAGQCMDNPMFGDQCEMYAGMGYCTPAYSHANAQNPQVQQQLQWIYENCPESCGLCIEAEV